VSEEVSKRSVRWGGKIKAPIALFAYNRPVHLRRTIEALLRNAQARQSDLFVFSDAAKSSGIAAEVDEVRRYIEHITGFASVHVVQREENLGLARSIIDGVSQLCNEYGRVIVVEDDLVTSPHFLRYMNEGLDLYANDEQVISVHGYVYPVKSALPETFFLCGADCWGWATWKRGWDLFEYDGRVLLRELQERDLSHRFDFDGAYPFTEMLRDQIAGKNDSWAIRWNASAFLKHKLTLYPGRSLVLNIGLDGTGTHPAETKEFSGAVADSRVAVERIACRENEAVRLEIIKYFRNTKPSLRARVARKLVDFVRRPG